MTEAAVGATDLVLWRTADGELVAMEARCPHQWSHLAYEGVVDGCELVCLSHLWRFRTDGTGWKVGMTGRADRKGDTVVFPCRTQDGRILVAVPDPR